MERQPVFVLILLSLNSLLLGDETIETPLEDRIAAAPCVVASLLSAGHTGMQEGSTKGGAGVVSTK